MVWRRALLGLAYRRASAPSSGPGEISTTPPSDDAVQDLGVKLTDLAFMISPLAFNTVR